MEITPKMITGLKTYLERISDGELIDIDIVLKKKRQGYYDDNFDVFIYTKIGKETDNPFYDHYLMNKYDTKVRDFLNMAGVNFNDGSVWFEFK